jgi:hypothetical protein
VGPRAVLESKALLRNNMEFSVESGKQRVDVCSKVKIMRRPSTKQEIYLPPINMEYPVKLQLVIAKA